MVGIVGAAVAGKETIDLAKSVGWKRLPRVVWRLMISPDKPIDASWEMTPPTGDHSNRALRHARSAYLWGMALADSGAEVA